MAVDSPDQSQTESILYDVGRYEVRNMIMSIQGAVAPVVYGGKIRAVLAYLDRQKMQARASPPLDVMNALDHFNVFLPTGDAKIGDTDYALDSNSMFDVAREMGAILLRSVHGNTAFLRDVARPEDASAIQTNVVRVNGPAGGLHPGLPAAWREHPGGRRYGSVPGSTRVHRPADARWDRLEGGDGSSRSTSASRLPAWCRKACSGSILCSLTILLFLGEWRMTAIAVLTLPIAVLSAIDLPERDRATRST